MTTLVDRIEPRYAMSEIEAAFLGLSLLNFAGDRNGMSTEDGQRNARARAWVELERALRSHSAPPEHS